MLKELKGKKECGVASRLLSNYWKNRGMPQYDVPFAERYLARGHKTEIVRDEFFAFHEAGKMLGLVSLITDVSNVAEIRDLVVEPSERHKGYGKRVLESIVETAKARGIRKLFALALPEAEQLYASAGFEKEGTLKSHFAPGEDLVIMSRFL